MGNHAVGLLLALLLLPSGSAAQVERLVIGQGGLDWLESSQGLLGLVDSVSVGSLQPVELDPTVNVAVGPNTESGQFTNIFGHIWEVNSNPPPLKSTSASEIRPLE